MNADQNATTYPSPRRPPAGAPYNSSTLPDPIGPYRIEREIGRGGMGHVYLAVRNDKTFQKRVAIKVLGCGHHARALEWRFRSERQILASLDHPNIARLLDGGTTRDGRPYFVMDHIEGQRIDRYCDQQRLTVHERLELFLQVCDAVQYAHRNLVVHRDIKPSNLLVTNEGVPKLLDFGIAKLLNPNLQAVCAEETVTGQHPMTPKYASPEQIRGQAITTASDVYSLGVLLYKLLTGRLPRQPKGLESLDSMLDNEPTSLSDAVCHTRSSDDATRGRLAEGGAGQAGRRRAGSLREDSDSAGVSLPETLAHLRRTPLQTLRHQLSGDLDHIALMALRLEPERRYGSVEQLAEDIRRHLQGRPVSAQADTFGYRFLKFLERHRWAVSVSAVALSIVMVLFGFMVQKTQLAAHEAQTSTAQCDRAKAERDRSEALAQLLLDTVTQQDNEGVAAERLLQRSLQQLEQTELADVDRRILRRRLLEAQRQAQPADTEAGPQAKLHDSEDSDQRSSPLMPPV